jgi:serine/threonine protein kinase/tetratricopeptide (TPR) repeat protein
MSASATTLPFLTALQQSGLFSAQEQQDLRHLILSAGLHLSDHKGMATWCVQQGYLTRFQAKQLLAGKWRNFIVSNKYKILEPLGQGGMGAVFRCEHISLGKEVALKVLPKELTKDADALKRFLREARALAALNHPNIVLAHDVDENNGQYSIVMACVDGRTLLDLVRQDGPLTPGQAASYIAQACRGSQHAHEAGWVHRDLKPGNLILDHSDTIKIMDFGLARLASSDGSITRHDGNTVLGSPDYISPEQAMNRAQIDIRADIYSLGATLYFLLAGRAPFEGEPLLQKLLAHQMREPEDVTFFRTDIPQGLIHVLKKMMAKNPDDRYATPAEVERALLPFSLDYGSSKAPSATNRARTSRTTRVPRVKNAARFPLADPLAATATADAMAQDTVQTAPSTAPEPLTEEQETAPLRLSRKTKLLLDGAAAVVTLVVAGILLTMWLNAPPDHEALLAQADRHGKQSNWKAAAAIYVQLLRETPLGSKERKAIYPRIKSWTVVAAMLLEQFPDDVDLCRLAVAHFVKQHEHDKALACMEKALAADSNNPDLWHDLGGQLVLRRQFAKAAHALEKAVSGKPDNHEWWRDLAFVYVAVGDDTNYRRVSREMLTKFSGSSRPWATRIDVPYVFGQGANPAPLVEEVLQLNAELRVSVIPFRHGSVLYRAGKWQEALDSLRQAQAKGKYAGFDPHQCDPLIAMAQYRLGQREEARRTLAEHRRWVAEESARRPGTLLPAVFDRWCDSLALDNHRREAEILIEGKPGS